MEDNRTAKDRYNELLPNRKPYENRAKDLSKLTIPYLYAPQGSNESAGMQDSYGARYASSAINSLAAQMALTLLPASGSSFRFDPDADGMQELTQGDANARAEIMALLGKETNRVNKEIENQMIRPVFNDFLLNIIAVSPVIVEKIKKDGIKYHGLDNICVKLDDKGEALEMCILDTLDPHDLPEGITVDDNTVDDVELYTWCKMRDGKWVVTQSIDSQVVGKESTFKEDECPYVYLGWTKQRGDKMHRPYAEQYQGLLVDYAAINKVLVEGSIVASKVLFLNNPLGVTSKSDISDSLNGDIIDGRQEDVHVLQVGKNYDFQIAMQMKNELKEQIDKAFLVKLGSSYAGRERVTAAEVQKDAQELEKNLAGMYSVMSKKFSKWLIKQIMKELGIKFEAINVNVITGLDALGKNIEAQKMDNFIARIANIGLNDYLNESEIITRYASYDGIDTVGLIKTPDEVSQVRQSRADAQARQQLLDSGAAQAGQNLANSAIPQQK